jgi:methyltransferase (TIGR00027 family)
MSSRSSGSSTDGKGPKRARQAPGQVKPSATAEIVCASRAAVTLTSRGKGLIDDPYARYFLRTPSVRARCATPSVARLSLSIFDRRYPGFMAIYLLRNCYYEEGLTGALAEGIDQVVLLGAGYDTSALRLDLGGADLYEIDAAPTQEAKRGCMDRHGLTPRHHVEYVTCDFERDDLPATLISRGFDPGRRSLVVWYGVSFFLSEAAVRRTLTDVAGLTAPGSRLLWDYMDASVVDGTAPHIGAKRAHAAVIKRNEPFTFGITQDGPGELMEHHGFTVAEHVRLPGLGRRYGGEAGVGWRTDDFWGVVNAVRQSES